MTAYISLIRGINVGGRKRVKMAALRDCYEAAGLTAVASYIQSGNVVFTSDESAAHLERTIVSAIQDTFGHEVSVILRTADDFDDIRENNPFPEQAAEAPNKLIVLFFSAAFDESKLRAILSDYEGPEQVSARERELIIWFPDGQGRSKFPTAKLEKAAGVPATARNWNAVRKLCEMAREKSG